MQNKLLSKILEREEEFYERFPLVECSAHERTSGALCICEELPDINEEKVAIKSFHRQSIISLLEEDVKRLEGKGYDFYFVLRNELDKITNSEKTKPI